MDGARFDMVSRLIAGGISRRGALKALLGGIVAGVALPEAADAAKCRGNGSVCIRNSDCCSHLCGEKDNHGRRHCTPCDNGVICGHTCCPPNALNACTEINGPNGPIIRCACPCESIYNVETNACERIGACQYDGECCSGKCCAGVCCDDGFDRCCGGVCANAKSCTCPDGTSCGAKLTCTSYGVVHTTGDVCCAYPHASYCCHDSYPGAKDGSAGCCMPGADCPEDGGCPSGYFTQSQTHHCCEDTDSDRRCGPNGDCCLNDFTVAPESSVLNCIINGKPCTRAYPCCTNTCRNGVCICRADDEPCTQHKECCSLTCYAATGTCKTLGAG